MLAALLVPGLTASLSAGSVTSAPTGPAGSDEPAVVLAARSAPAAGTARAPGSAPATRTASARPVDLALVLPRGVADAGGLTPAAVRAQVAAASSYWSEQTGGLVRFQVAATQGWYRSALPCSDGRGIWSEAAARFGASGGTSGRHLVIVVPPARAAAAGCGYGFGTQGEVTTMASLRGSGQTTGRGVATDGGTVFITNAVPSLLAHELGHNLGLDHAGSLTCAGVQDGRYAAGAWPRGCALREYDDLYDVMGYSSPGYGEGHLNAGHLDQLGLDPSAVTIARTGTSSYRLARLSALGTAGRAVRIEDPSGPVYYLEYRTATGRDRAATRTPLGARSGLRILRADPRFPGATATLELDASPPARVGGAPAPADYDRALPVGGVFRAASGQVAVRLDAAAAGGASVRVHVGPGAATALGTSLPAVARRASTAARVVPRPDAAAPRLVAAGRRFAVRVSVRSSVASGSRWALVLQRQAAGRWRQVAKVVTTPSARGRAAGAAGVRQVRGRASYRWVVTGVIPAGSRSAVPPAGRARLSGVVVVTAR